MYAYILDRGMDEVVRRGFETAAEAETAGLAEAAILCEKGLDTWFVGVLKEQEDGTLVYVQPKLKLSS